MEWDFCSVNQNNFWHIFVEERYSTLKDCYMKLLDRTARKRENIVIDYFCTMIHRLIPRVKNIRSITSIGVCAWCFIVSPKVTFAKQFVNFKNIPDIWFVSCELFKELVFRNLHSSSYGNVKLCVKIKIILRHIQIQQQRTRPLTL